MSCPASFHLATLVCIEASMRAPLPTCNEHCARVVHVPHYITVCVIFIGTG